MTALSEIYAAAADILAGEGAWTQGAAARDAEGRETLRGAYDPEAVSFDALGALERAVGRLHGAYPVQTRVLLFWQALEGLFDTDEEALAFNDAPGRTQAQVVRLFRLAAETADLPPSARPRLSSVRA